MNGETRVQVLVGHCGLIVLPQGGKDDVRV